MKVTVRFFASHREATGVSRCLLDIPEGASAAEALEAVCRRFPPLAALAPGCAFAVNRSQVAGSTTLREDDELALLPPMAGG